MFKLQLAIEKFFLSAIVIVVAIVVSYFLFKSFYSVVSHTSIKSYLTQASFDDIYGNKTNIFILLKNETNIGSNVIISEMITFNNGTSKTYSIPFALQMASPSGGGFLYDFATTNFPAISNNSQPIKISNVFIISGNYTIESENSSITYSSYYYTKSSLENIPLYYLNMSVTPLGAGDLAPGNGYYYAGSKVAISEKPNIGYAFSGWSGFGNGNYTGPNQTAIIEMNSNITEYAKYVKLVKIFVNATYNGIPVYVNSALNTTTNGTIYLMPNIKYTISFPEYVTFSNGTRYAFKSLQDNCGISISPNSNSTTFVSSYANYNCKFMANYTKQYYLTIYSNNTTMGTVTPSGGWYNKGNTVEISATPLSGYAFSDWQGSGAGSYSGTNNPANVIIEGPISEEAFFTIAPVYNPTSYNGSGNVIFNNNVTLKGNIIANSVTIYSGVTLTTNGYSIICNTNFTNNGIIDTGSGASGGAPYGSNGGSVTTSYAGSGGGGGGGAYPGGSSGGNGGSTVSPGGSGGSAGSQSSSGSSGSNGGTPSAPTLNNSVIQTWYNNGIQNYLEGAGGGGGGSSYYGGASGGQGGNGGAGIYIQARNIVAGIINSNGENGYDSPYSYTGGGGGGGGGSILLAYNTNYTPGTYNTNGGAGGSGDYGLGNGGNGGNGLVLIYHYITPPISPP